MVLSKLPVLSPTDAICTRSGGNIGLSDIGLANPWPASISCLTSVRDLAMTLFSQACEARVITSGNGTPARNRVDIVAATRESSLITMIFPISGIRSMRDIRTQFVIQPLHGRHYECHHDDNHEYHEDGDHGWIHQGAFHLLGRVGVLFDVVRHLTQGLLQVAGFLCYSDGATVEARECQGVFGESLRRLHAVPDIRGDLCHNLLQTAVGDLALQQVHGGGNVEARLYH